MKFPSSSVQPEGFGNVKAIKILTSAAVVFGLLFFGVSEYNKRHQEQEDK